jgi:hypothetical protein
MMHGQGNVTLYPTRPNTRALKFQRLLTNSYSTVKLGILNASVTNFSVRIVTCDHMVIYDTDIECSL